MSHFTHLASIRALINDLIALPMPTDEQVPDVVGEVRALEVKLAEWRRGLVVETPAGVGENYAIVQSRKATRTYNIAAILRTVSDDQLAALIMLKQAGAVKIEPQWTKLQRFFADRGLELRVVPREISESGEIVGAHVGQVWETATAIKGVEQR